MSVWGWSQTWNTIWNYPTFKAHDEKLARWKADLAVRAKIQCLMCSFAGVKTSNMARHYVDVHGYDASIAHAPDADDEMPDGALCTG